MVVINSSSMILGFVSITKAVTVAPKPLRVGSTVVALCSIERHDTARNVFSPNHKPQIRRECLQPPNFAIVRIVRLNPQQYHLLARTALWLLAVIVVSGASVRLTGSGLGCSDWPNCEPGHLIPEADFHAWVEFGNRIVTGLVSIAVVFDVAQTACYEVNEVVLGAGCGSCDTDCAWRDNGDYSFIASNCYGAFLVVDGAYLERDGS